MRDANGDDTPHPFPMLQSEEALALKGVVTRLGSQLAEHGVAVGRRFDAVEAGQRAVVQGVKLEISALRDDLRDAVGKKFPSDPPRRETPSYHDVVEQAAHETRVKIQAEAKKTVGPLVDPEAAERIATDVWQRKMSEMREADRVKANEERLAALDAAEAKRLAEVVRVDNERREDRRKIKMKFWGGLAAALGAGVLGIITAIATYGAQAAKAREAGRLEGIREVQVQQAPAAWGSAAKPPAHP